MHSIKFVNLIPFLKNNRDQKNAEKDQRWPLINLVRQILHKYGYIMEPIRKADGYSLDGTIRIKFGNCTPPVKKVT